MCKRNDIKNCKYYVFNDMMNIKRPAPNKILIDKKSNKNILIYYVRYVIPSSVKPLYLIINK